MRTLEPCTTCRFFVPPRKDVGHVLGECHKLPPTARDGYPMCRPEAPGCGAWETKEEPWYDT